jgi:hypothetical protein
MIAGAPSIAATVALKADDGPHAGVAGSLDEEEVVTGEPRRRIPDHRPGSSTTSPAM